MAERTILVTGATGQQGGAVVRELAGKGFTLRAMTRKPEGDAARALAARGVTLVQADLDDEASLERALDGVWGVFAVQTMLEGGVAKEEEQGKRIATVARAKGVTHFVYTSVGSANRRTGIPHFESKWQIEETVRALAFPSHVILRPVAFMDTMFGPRSLAGSELFGATQPTTKLQFIAVDDVGKFGALAFEAAETLNRSEIDLAGDSLTMPEAAKIFAGVLVKPFHYVQMPIAQVRARSEDMALMIEWFDRVGYDVDIPSLVAKYGIRPLTLAEWAKRRAG